MDVSTRIICRRGVGLAVFAHLRKVTSPNASSEEARNALDLSHADHFFQGDIYRRRVRLRGQRLSGLS